VVLREVFDYFGARAFEKIVRKSVVHIWDNMLFSQGAYASLNKGDI